MKKPRWARRKIKITVEGIGHDRREARLNGHRILRARSRGRSMDSRTFNDQKVSKITNGPNKGKFKATVSASFFKR